MDWLDTDWLDTDWLEMDLPDMDLIDTDLTDRDWAVDQSLGTELLERYLDRRWMEMRKFRLAERHRNRDCLRSSGQAFDPTQIGPQGSSLYSKHFRTDLEWVA